MKTVKIEAESSEDFGVFTNGWTYKIYNGTGRKFD